MSECEATEPKPTNAAAALIYARQGCEMYRRRWQGLITAIEPAELSNIVNDACDRLESSAVFADKAMAILAKFGGHVLAVDAYENDLKRPDDDVDEQDLKKALAAAEKDLNRLTAALPMTDDGVAIVPEMEVWRERTEPGWSWYRVLSVEGGGKVIVENSHGGVSTFEGAALVSKPISHAKAVTRSPRNPQ